MRIPEINETLKAFVQVLVKEEVRDKFVGREAYKILTLRKNIKQDKNYSEDTAKRAEKIKEECMKNSILANHLSQIFESYLTGQSKKLLINHWVQLEINQHPNGLPVNNVETGFLKDG